MTIYLKQPTSRSIVPLSMHSLFYFKCSARLFTFFTSDSKLLPFSLHLRLPFLPLFVNRNKIAQRKAFAITIIMTNPNLKSPSSPPAHVSSRTIAQSNLIIDRVLRTQGTRGVTKMFHHITSGHASSSLPSTKSHPKLRPNHRPYRTLVSQIAFNSSIQKFIY